MSAASKKKRARARADGTWVRKGDCLVLDVSQPDGLNRIERAVANGGDPDMPPELWEKIKAERAAMEAKCAAQGIPKEATRNFRVNSELTYINATFDRLWNR
jgi:hypothetical protein